MARTEKADTQAAEQKIQQMDMDAGGQPVTPDGVQDAAESMLAAGGPEDEAELAEGVLQPYAVTHEGGLRLRQEPHLFASTIAVLPCGAGVFVDGESGPQGWLHVLTGRLSGWMMAKYLEALPLPELDDGTG